MRRADRLFQLVQLLRRRRFVTAAQLAERLEVSQRTVYRDIQDLVAGGVPVLGEAGVGYRLERGFELPPLMFTLDEIDALVLGARMVARFGDAALRASAASILDKVDAVLPESHRARLQDSRLLSPRFQGQDGSAQHLGTLREATQAQKKVAITYRDGSGRGSERVVRPLCLAFWGPTWTLGAYCELREGFRNFRLDRIDTLRVLEERFELEPPVTLEDYIRAVS